MPVAIAALGTDSPPAKRSEGHIANFTETEKDDPAEITYASSKSSEDARVMHEATCILNSC